MRGLAYAEASSTEIAREINRDIVLELIRARQPVARVELARLSGLQNSTVSSIVEQLLQEGWIREGALRKTARGRRPTQIALNDQVAILVANVHADRAIVAAVDLNGVILSRSSIPLPHGASAGVLSLATELRNVQNAHPDKVFEGVGICLPGRIDADTGRLVLAPNLNWMDFPLRDTLEEELKLKVELENNANACLLSELWFGHLDGVRNGVLLAISEGLGASLLAEGHVISGLRGLAGEFGHLCFDPAGPKCGCGRTGCWEVFASCNAALRYYRELMPRSRVNDFQKLCRLADEGDTAAIGALHRQAEAIGKGLRMVTATMSPEVILFAGEIAYSWAMIQPILVRECSAGMLGGECPRLLCTGDGEDAHLLGAAAVVLQRHTGYYRAWNSYGGREHGRETRSAA